MTIRLWPKTETGEITHMDWDQFNVPVWAMEGGKSGDPDHAGFLFVRTYSPRVNRMAVDVIEGGTLELVPNAIDVGKFYDKID
jgi:hypothetical protein